MLNQKDISLLVKGDKVDHYFIITKCELRISKRNDEFLSIEFSDKSSSISANLWKDRKEFDELKSIYNNGNILNRIVKVTGEVSEFNNILNINFDSLLFADESDNVSYRDFLKTTDRNIDEMRNELKLSINKIENKYLKKLLTNTFINDLHDKFSEHPAGKIWHHSYLGGLLEHTLEIISICNLMCNFHKEINRDLLITGAILHDLGKIFEISSQPGFEYSSEGKLLGHIAIAAMIIDKEINRIKGFPDDLRMNLLHLILSHQGKLEQASPVVPKTLEAIVLYHADELSAKANAFKLTLQREQKSPSGWTKYINLAGTELYSHNINHKSDQETIFD
jgi:3'-5' exoribonuclease